MEMKERKILKNIKSFLDMDEILVIQGARQVGKTTLMKMLIEDLKKKGVSESQIMYLDLEDINLLSLCNQGVNETISYVKSRTSGKGKCFIFIDEIQYLDNPSGFLKLFYEHYRNDYKLIVSGSSSFEIRKKFKDSLVGRIIVFELYGLDFEEYLHFKGKTYNLKNLKSSLAQKELIGLFKEYLIYGGYPRVALIDNITQKETYLKQVINTYLKKDIRDIGDIRNVQKFNDLLLILSDQSGSLVNIDELANTIGIARETVYDYLFIMENTYIIKKIPPYHKNIRTELTKMPKIYFEDTGVLNFLRYGAFIEKIDGILFENGIFSIIRKNIPGESIKFWRTTERQEIDFIIDVPSKPIMGFEVKLRYNRQPIRNIVSFKKKYPESQVKIVTLEKMKPPKDKTIPLVFPWEIIGN